jgi:PDZ domain/Aspartyl protease
VKFRFITFLILTGFSLVLGFVLRDRAQNKVKAQVSFPGDSVEIPFETYGNHLYLHGKINNAVTHDLLLDSGAADIFISQSKAQAFNLKSVGKSSIPGGAAGQVLTNRVKGVTLQLGALTLKDEESVVIPTAETTKLGQYFGRTVTGIVGYELFQQHVVEVDYQHRVLRLHRPQTYRYQGKAKPISLKVQGERPYVEMTVSPYGFSALKGLFLIDLGSGGALSLATGCGLDQRLIAAVPQILVRKLSTIHGAENIRLGRIRQVQIAQQSLDRPLAVFTADPKGECDRATGKIGNQILRQFKVILDYPHRQLILEPHPRGASPDPYDYDLSGLWLQATGTDFKTYRIETVYPNTPAAKAGMQSGDILKEINGQSTQKLNLPQIRQQLSQSGKNIELVVERAAKQIQTDFTLKSLL